MTENKTPDLEEMNEEVESVDDLKDMIKTLNELPTEVLEQLVNNLEEIEAYNADHPEDDNTDAE